MEKATKETDVNQSKTEQMDGHSLNGKCSGVLSEICSPVDLCFTSVENWNSFCYISK